jgi:hypothetical protein
MNSMTTTMSDRRLMVRARDELNRALLLSDMAEGEDDEARTALEAVVCRRIEEAIAYLQQVRGEPATRRR